MKIKQTILIICIMSFFGGLFIAPNVSAATCAGVETAFIECPETGRCDDGWYLDDDVCVNEVDGTTKPAADVSIEDSGLWSLLEMVINILTGGIGIVAVGGIIYGSIMYITAGGSADKIKKGITIITDVVIGIVCWALMYAILSYLIPGGIFG